MSAGQVIHDFVHSTNPKFEGKSKKKRIQMALAAHYAKQRNEDVDAAVNALLETPDPKDHMTKLVEMVENKNAVGFKDELYHRLDAKASTALEESKKVVAQNLTETTGKKLHHKNEMGRMDAAHENEFIVAHHVETLKEDDVQPISMLEKVRRILSESKDTPPVGRSSTKMRNHIIKHFEGKALKFFGRTSNPYSDIQITHARIPKKHVSKLRSHLESHGWHQNNTGTRTEVAHHYVKDGHTSVIVPHDGNVRVIGRKHAKNLPYYD